MDPLKEFQLIRGIFSFSLLCLVALTFLVVLGLTRWGYVLLLLLLLVPLTWLGIGYLFRKGKNVSLFLALAVLNMAVLLPELALRAADFRYEAGIQFGYPRPSQFQGFVPDRLLFWKLSPSSPNTNSLGFRGKEIAIPKPQNEYRSLYLGDSITFEGYPEIVDAFLNADYPQGPRRFKSVNLSIPGYSSYQGRVLSELYGAKLEPDLVVVFYGWNDHSQAWGAPDSRKVVRESGSGAERVMGLVYENSRLVQWFARLRDSASGANEPLATPRVLPDEYRANLKAIAARFQPQRVPVVFMTAPTLHYRRGVPDFLIRLKIVRDQQSGIALHKEYAGVVRDVAGETGSFLLDLEAEFESTPTEDLEELYMSDGIHFRERGLAVVARRIAEFMKEKGLAK